MIDVGTVLADRYELQERLGVGGMGEVYRAYDRRFRLDVAIKALLPHVSRDEQLVERFLREGRTLALLRHPGIIGIFDMLHLDGNDFLVLEFVPGHSLEDELAGDRMPWSRCADIGAQVCGALAAAHARDVVHRDIKPSNILLEPSGLVRVADFGIARLASNVSQVTRAGMSMGTPGFWAPEQALGQVSTPQTDLYSLGAVLFMASTARLPFVAEEEGPAAAFLSVTRPVPDPREVAPDLPAPAAALIMRALAKDPADRFSSAMEMAQALRVSAGLPLVPVTPFETPFPDPGELRAPPTEEESTGASSAPGAPSTVHTGQSGMGIAPDPPPVVGPGAPETEVDPPALDTEAQPGAPETEMGPPTPDTELQPGAPDTEVQRGAPETEVREGAGPAADARQPTGGVSSPETTPRRPSPRVLVAIGCVGLVVIAAIAGLVAGGALGGGESEPAESGATDRVSGGRGSVAVPPTWQTSAGASFPGLTLFDATTATPDRASGEKMLIGRVDAEGPTLLPSGLQQALAGIPEGEPVLLGKIQAYRYGDVRVEGFPGPVTLFMVPTTQGVQAVVCAAPANRAAAFLPACESAAATLRLRGARAFPLGPSASYAEAVTAAMTRLNGRRATLRTQLTKAATPDAQADVARQLADAYAAAAAALTGQNLGPEGAGLNEQLVAALRAPASAYRKLADAAESGDSAGYDAARQSVRDAERRLAQAFNALEARGYKVTS